MTSNIHRMALLSGMMILALTACSQKTEDHAARAADQAGAATSSAVRDTGANASAGAANLGTAVDKAADDTVATAGVAARKTHAAAVAAAKTQ